MLFYCFSMRIYLLLNFKFFKQLSCPKNLIYSFLLCASEVEESAGGNFFMQIKHIIGLPEVFFLLLGYSELREGDNLEYFILTLERHIKVGLRVSGYGGPNSDDWTESLAPCILCWLITMYKIVHINLRRRKTHWEHSGNIKLPLYKNVFYTAAWYNSHRHQK